jgi:alpha-mannosidase
MMLYGYGDGGGGPTADIMERIERLQDCDAIPRIISADPIDFFRQVNCLNYIKSKPDK